MPHLFDPLSIRNLTFSNRVFVSPMCEYSSTDGFANDWHFVHLGSRAVGGAALVFTEATAVTPEGRISPEDLGIWKDDHIEMLARIVSFVHAQGSIAGMQLAHAGRKASTYRPWSGDGAVPESEGGWTNVVAPSAVKFTDTYPQPRDMTARDITDTIEAFVAAAKRASAAGFRVIEIHAAHGYLIHEFLSPLSNHRTDDYGGSFDNRTRLLRQIAEAVRHVWPGDLPLFTRISATDWTDDWLGYRAVDRACAPVEGLRRRFHRLFVRRKCRDGKDSDWTRLPDLVRGADSPRGEYPDRLGRHDHLRDAGGAHRRHRTGRCGADRAGVTARPVLPTAGCTRARAGHHVARAVPASRVRAAPSHAPHWDNDRRWRSRNARS